MTANRYALVVETAIGVYSVMDSEDFIRVENRMRRTINDIEQGRFINVRQGVDEVGITRREINPRHIESVSIREVRM